MCFRLPVSAPFLSFSHLGIGGETNLRFNFDTEPIEQAQTKKQDN